MEFLDVKIEQLQKQEQQNDLAVSTAHDDENSSTFVQEKVSMVKKNVSVVEEEVEISAVVDSAADDVAANDVAAASAASDSDSASAIAAVAAVAAVAAKVPASNVESTSPELQSVGKKSLDEVVVVDKTEEGNVVPPATSIAITVEPSQEVVFAVDTEDTVADEEIALSSSVVTVIEKAVEQEQSQDLQEMEEVQVQEKDKDREPFIVKKVQKSNDDDNDDDAAQVEVVEARQPEQSSQDGETASVSTVTAPTDDAEDMDIDYAELDKRSMRSDSRNTAGGQAKAAKSTKAPIIAFEKEEEEDMPEYEVEKIVGHRTYKGKVVKYIVKWKGYSSSESTTENADTLHEDVPELCAAYWVTCKDKKPDNVPHVAEIDVELLIEQEQTQDDDDTYNQPPAVKRSSSRRATSSKVKPETRANEEKEKEASPAVSKRKRPSSSSGDGDQDADDDNDNDTKPASAKKFKKNMEHVPDYMVKLGYEFPVHWPNKKTKWSVDVKKVCVQASPLDNSIRFTYIEWKNGEKTIHPMKEAHIKIPDKLIHYYEERLQFV